MTGMLMWAQPRRWGKSVLVAAQRVAGAPFWRADVAPLRQDGQPSHRRILRAGKALKARGVKQVVVPRDFAHWEWLEACGLEKVPTLPLRCVIAADWLRWLLRERPGPLSEARILVAADRLTGEVVRTVTELALRHRYVLVDLPYGSGELCRRMQREYGAAILSGPTQEQMSRADGAVLFAPRSAAPAVSVRLYDKEAALPPLSLPPVMEESLPEGADRGQLLGALWNMGVLRPGQFTVGSEIS